MVWSFDNEVDAALVNGGSIRVDDMLPKDLSSMDVFRTLPFGGGILKVGDKTRVKKAQGIQIFTMYFNYSIV